jgi:Cu/Ag efflux protein CusF
MDMRIIASGLLVALAAVMPVMAQDAAATKVKYVSVIGTVEKVDASGKVLTVKPDKTDGSSVKFDDKTQFLRIPAGETDTKKATRAAAADVSVGDRVIARLRAGEETQAAVFLYFTKQTELAQRKAKTAEEWQKDGVTGLVSSVDPNGKKIVLSVRNAGPPRDVTLDVAGNNVDFTRFSPETGKAEPSALAAIHTGDQVTVIGQKNADATAIKVEAITSGFYKTLPVQIKSIDAGTGQILAMDLASKKPITITIHPETTMKKLDDATALQMARRLNPTFQQSGGRGRGGRGGGADANAGANPDGGAPTGFQRPDQADGAQGRGGRGGAGGRNVDLSKVLDQQPTITLADLKAGEPIVVAGAPTEDMSQMRALKLIAGVDPILRAAPQNGPDPLGGNWSLGGGGEGGGGAQ